MTTPRVDPFADLAGLANRIAQKLKANPKDAQLRDDLRYVRSLMPESARNVSATDNPPQAPAGQQVMAGLTSVPGDVIQGAMSAIRPSPQMMGQMTGLGNREALLATAQDPTAGIPEKLDAIVRATPLNMGYAPFRSFLESTGMKSDEAAPLSEQVRQGGDIAAGLALMRVDPTKVPNAVLRLVRGVLPRWAREIQPRVSAALGPAAAPETVGGVTEAMIRSRLARQGFPPESVEQLVATWKRGGQPEAPITARPGETMTQVAPKGFEVSGQRATPPAPTNGSFWEQVHGTPVRDLGKGQTLPYYPRGGMVEQSLAPQPVQSPGGGMMDKQLPMMLEWLKGSPAGEEASRVATLRALGVPLGPTAEGDLLQFLGRTPQ